MEEDAPGAKQKKAVTGHEVLAMLKDHKNDVAKVANEMLEELCPFDLNDQDKPSPVGPIQTHYCWNGQKDQKELVVCTEIECKVESMFTEEANAYRSLV